MDWDEWDGKTEKIHENKEKSKSKKKKKKKDSEDELQDPEFEVNIKF